MDTTKKTRSVTLTTGLLTLLGGILVGAAVFHGLCLLAGGPSVLRTGPIVTSRG